MAVCHCQSKEKESPRRDTGGQTRQSSMFVFLHQWCMTSLSHPADCLPGLHAHTSTVMILPATRSTFTALQWLSNNSTTQCHPHPHTHTHSLQHAAALTNSISACLHKCSWSWNDRIHREDPINVYLFHCCYHFSWFHLGSLRQYINYFQCNYGSNQLQPL